MRPCLIAIDMDGTLLGSDGHVSPRNRAALQLAEDAGAEIVIATGRRHAFAMKVLRELDLRGSNAIISSNGTVIRTIASELLHRTHMPVDTARWLCGQVDEFRDSFVLTFDRIGEDGDDRRGALVCENNSTLHGSIGAWMRSNERYIASVERMEHALAASAEHDSDALARAPIQAMLCGTVERMERAELALAAHPEVAGFGQPEAPGHKIVLHRTVYPQRDLAIVDILPAGCSKASALAHLAQLRGCTLNEVLAIGDNWNDVPMLEAAGSAVLMGNAPDDLKELAHHHGWTIGPSNDQDGVAVAIEAALHGG